MIIQVDTREKARAIKKILSEFDKQDIKHFSSKLPVADYMNLDNAKLVIDRKQNLSELCQNVCQGHERFVRGEIKLANDLGIKMIILCEHGENIKTLEDVYHWENPRLKESPLAVSGRRLHKILSTLQQTYGVDFLFCEKSETGKKILELLSGCGGQSSFKENICQIES